MTYLILNFQDQPTAQTVLDAINLKVITYWRSQGYTIVSGTNPDGTAGSFLVGKNALTGVDNPNALTKTWDYVVQSPTGTFYYSSPNNDLRFANIVASLTLGNGQEIPLPAGWPNPAEFSASEFSNTEIATGR